MQKNVKNVKNKDLVNENIRFKEMLIVLPDGERKGPVSKQEAMTIAGELGLDLLIVSANSNMPVAKILDYGKWKYESKKKLKESKKNQHVVDIKEMRLRNGIGDHDIEFKAKKVRGFIEDGSRVKISLKFRGREIAKPQYGIETLNKFFSYLEDIAKIDSAPKLSGPFMDMYIVPKTSK
ncbi:translation initiation factor IF-3 [Spiroplasma endosymbiont of Anurida maritima]|uniref:translation initiation factor IF-3 n=1 Tax=Spiroplasma endosymbiont of Anurida maritima TaxID=2967972 RepID=UPI0036D389F4